MKIVLPPIALSPRILTARKRLFTLIEPNVKLADLVGRARDEVAAVYTNTHDNPLLESSAKDPKEAQLIKGKISSTTTTEEFYKFTSAYGIGSDILKLTSLLRKSPMDDLPRLLLATHGVYESILLKCFKRDLDSISASRIHEVASDTEGLRQSIMVDLQTPRDTFVKALVDLFIADRGLSLQEDDPNYTAFIAAVDSAVIPIDQSRTITFLQRIYDTTTSQSTLSQYVEKYKARGEIEPQRFTDSISKAMVQYLRAIGLNTKDITDAKFNKGDYDEYFAQAYQSAIQGSSGSGAIFQSVEPLDSDFNLDLFDAIDDRGIIRENILAASALAYFHLLGDTLGIFPLVNSLLLRRARGRLDLARGPAAQRLQQLKDWLRRTSVTTEDRLLLYRRVFNAGDGEVLPDTVVNEEYPTMLHTLMEKVVDFIRKEESVNTTDRVSRAAIDEAVRNLQYNLSYFANDIAEDTLVIKEHFNLATAILSDDEIISALGVSRRGNMWGVLQRLVPEELNRSFSVNTMRTLGVETYRVLQYVANYDVTTPEEEFRKFLSSAESLIIAQSSMGDLTTGEDGDTGSSENETDDWGEDEDSENEPSTKNRNSDF